jgi:hypothetical protein
MDYIQAMNWLTAIAVICVFLAAGLVVLEILSWADGWRERRAARKRNHANPWKKGW